MKRIISYHLFSSYFFASYLFSSYFFFPLFLQAQQIQYVAKVLKYSSDLGGKLNSVKRIIGKPDAFPQGGQSANAWVSKDALGSAFVEVEFEKAQTVRQIAVFENLNAGCVTRIMVGDATGKMHTVSKKSGGFIRWMNTLQTKGNSDRAYYFNKKRRKIEIAPDVESNADIEYFYLETPEPNVKIMRVDFDFSQKPGQKQIDAIAISDSETQILPQINTTSAFENLASPEKLIYSPDKDYDLGAISVMDNTLYYTVSMYEKAGEIHALRLVNPAEIIDVSKTIQNEKKLNYLLGYAPETKTILMGSEGKYRRDGEALGFDFFKLEGALYTYQKPLKIVAFSNYGDYADAFLTRDGKRIIFGIESDLTVGGFDLYFTQPKDEETYGFLQNMGRGLNTAGDETNPFLLSDNKTLIFASNGYASYGDFDLYVSTRLDETWKNWSEPINLGPKVNGKSFDTSPYYDEKTELLYYVSFKDGSTVINKIKIPLVQLNGAK